MRSTKNSGFTLVELLISAILLAILAIGFITGNYFPSVRKGRDAVRKADLQNIQKALELYYEDNRAYPIANGNISLLGSPFQSGGQVYMQKLPNDPVSGKWYHYISDGTYYKLFSCIEYDGDAGPGVCQGTNVGYKSTNCGQCPPPSGNTLCKFAVVSSNTSVTCP
ncbi:type II secretion system protein GspG [Candidatus Roizmanbacteria bacterium]|nr:type II secretion system protein GspG [Candidatus Roizmanbacteria bacterium]